MDPILTHLIVAALAGVGGYATRSGVLHLESTAKARALSTINAALAKVEAIKVNQDAIAAAQVAQAAETAALTALKNRVAAI